MVVLVFFMSLRLFILDLRSILFILPFASMVPFIEPWLMVPFCIVPLVVVPPCIVPFCMVPLVPLCIVPEVVGVVWAKATVLKQKAQAAVKRNLVVFMAILI